MVLVSITMNKYFYVCKITSNLSAIDNSIEELFLLEYIKTILTENQYKVLYLYYMYHLTSVDIAKELGITYSAVINRKYMAKKKILKGYFKNVKRREGKEIT